MAIAKHIQQTIDRYSWIRRMFEEGNRLKAEFGADHVFDLSLGNLDVEPPESFRQALLAEIHDRTPGAHRYMPNAGLPDTRAMVAEYVSRDQGVEVSADEVCMTTGAAGALNCALKAILDPGDEVIVPSPFFVEYGFYVQNHGGVLQPVPSLCDFSLDLAALATAVTAQTKVVLVNSPNNPTGCVYDEAGIDGLVDLVEARSREYGKVIYIVSDEPYRRFVYGDARVPSILARYRNTIVTGSYSKDLAIAGERLGYLVARPDADDAGALMGAVVLANRILGYVNAPALMQRVVRRIQGECVDTAVFEARRDLLCAGLAEAGYDFTVPDGAFYVFPKSPIPSDVSFVQMLQKRNVLVLPGSGFGAPGYFRISYCAGKDVLERALPAFHATYKEALVAAPAG